MILQKNMNVIYLAVAAMAASFLAVSCAQSGTSLQPSSVAENKSLPPDTLARVETYWKSRLPSYMEGSSEPVTYPGWEGFPTRRHRYRTDDGKTAEVIMCNPNARQLARWIVNTCLLVKGNAEERHTDKLSRHILLQSGAQFPVAGIVLETMGGGGHAMYAFREGVTVEIPGIQNGSRSQPRAEQIADALDSAIVPLSAKTFARIQSTTRTQYHAAGGTEPTEGRAWLTVSRKLYQNAWGNDRNELMIAWAKQNL